MFQMSSGKRKKVNKRRKSFFSSASDRAMTFFFPANIIQSFLSVATFEGLR